MPLIGEGAYGEVYRPPMTCKKTHNYANKIGKVFRKEKSYAYEKELDIMKRVNKINSKHEFAIPMYYTCPEIKQIVYADGGIDLFDYLALYKPSKNSFMKLLEQMRHICRGIIKLLENGYVHNDIKIENIVFNGKKLYLIDFGLMRNESEIYKMVHEFDYAAYPPEYKRYLSKTNFIKRFEKNFDDGLLLHIGTYYKDMYKDLESLLSTPSYPTDKIDIYSLGIVIAYLYRWYMKIGSAIPTVESIIRGMVCMDPMRRYSAEDALREIDLFLESRKHV